MGGEPLAEDVLRELVELRGPDGPLAAWGVGGDGDCVLLYVGDCHYSSGFARGGSLDFECTLARERAPSEVGLSFLSFFLGGGGIGLFHGHVSFLSSFDGENPLLVVSSTILRFRDGLLGWYL